jgi:DNA-binding MarR family transcriptional regulator
VPLKRLWGEHNPTAADRAALSRALRDLEDRDLLYRTHAQELSPSLSVRRCSQVLLTPSGASMAQTLTLSSKR